MKPLSAYAKFLRESGLQKQTIKNYLWHTEKFLNSLDSSKLDNDRIQSYRLQLLKSSYSPATINLHLASLKRYLKYLGQNISLDFTTRAPRQLYSLSPGQLEKFWASLSGTDRLLDLRDRTLISLIYDTGLKVGKIIPLKISQLDTIQRKIILDDQQIKIRPAAWAYLQKYLHRRVDNIDYLFINLDRAGKGVEPNLSIRSVERIIDKYGKKAGLKVNPQILHNTKTKILKSEGAGAQQIQSAVSFKTKLGANNYLQQI